MGSYVGRGSADLGKPDETIFHDAKSGEEYKQKHDWFQRSTPEVVVEEVDTCFLLIDEEASGRWIKRSKSKPILPTDNRLEQIEIKSKRSKSCENRYTKRAAK